jgi:transposase
MSYVQGLRPGESFLLPPCLDDFVPAESPVRFLAAFVDVLDLKLAGFRFPKEHVLGLGRPAYHPAVLLKLYLYGYTHRLRSSRQLAGECQRNLEVMWLVGALRPDFKTIADFRKDNHAAFTAVAKEFTRLCRDLQLFGGELLAIDGTKVKGQNAAGKNWSVAKLEKQDRAIAARVQEYLAAIEQADALAGPTPKGLSADELKAKVERLRARGQEVKARLERLRQSGAQQVSQTDPDSRGMKGAHGHVVGYNVQGAVDARHHLLAVVAATQEVTDQGSLAAVAAQAKEELGIQQAEVLADGGYYNKEKIKACQDMGMEPRLPAVKNSNSERQGLYGKRDFQYDPRRDVYTCPAGAVLGRRRAMGPAGERIFNYEHPKACAQCPLKGRCTTAASRTVSRWEHEEALERMTKLVAAEPAKLARRKTLIEHCWGTLKWLLPGGFLLKGLKKVQAELSLVHVAYNLRRALRVVGLPGLLAHLRAKTA